jgi:hypothetical protein
VSSVFLKPTSGLVPTPVPDPNESEVNQIRDRRWNQSRIPSLSLLGCCSLGLSFVSYSSSEPETTDTKQRSDSAPRRGTTGHIFATFQGAVNRFHRLRSRRSVPVPNGVVGHRRL